MLIEKLLAEQFFADKLTLCFCGLQKSLNIFYCKKFDKFTVIFSIVGKFLD